MSQTLKGRRQGYMQLARNSAKETNKIRGLLTFVSKKSKKSTYKNKLIDQLLADNTYQNIYAKYMDYVDNTKEDNEEVYKYLNDKELEILLLFDYVKPDKLHTKKDGYYIEEIPIHLEKTHSSDDDN